MWSRHFNFLMSIIDQPLINIIKNKRGGNLPVCSIVSTLFMVKSVLGCSNPKLNRVKVFLSTTPLNLRHIFTGRNEVLAKVIFLHLFVILFTGGGGSGKENPPGLGEHPPGMENPPRPDTSSPRRQTPPWRPPQAWRPPREADSGIRSTIGRYASYWNAFLFFLSSVQCFASQIVSYRD